MMSLINIHEGNSFYNYITPSTQGEIAGDPYNFLNNFFATRLQYGVSWVENSARFGLRFPAPGLETRTDNVDGLYSNAVRFAHSFRTSDSTWFINTSQTNGQIVRCGGWHNTSADPIVLPTWKTFAVMNDYSLTFCGGSSLSNLTYFLYIGWLRESYYTSPANAILGAVYIRAETQTAWRYSFSPTAVGSATQKLISTASGSITNPPIACVDNTNQSADATDIIVRDNTAPNLAIGKLYNCVSLPNTAAVGTIWTNNGIDPDTGLQHTSYNSNKYLVVRPWGSRKLGMRIWADGFVE